MYCKNCGGRIEDGQKFCTYCGSKVDESSENKESNNNQSGPYISYESLTGHSADEPHTSLTGKSRVFAGLMAILLGAGIHNFYLGYNKKAVAQLLIYILSTVLLYAAQSSDASSYWYFYSAGIIASAISGIWCFVEGILLLTGKIKADGSGKPLK